METVIVSYIHKTIPESFQCRLTHILCFGPTAAFVVVCTTTETASAVFSTNSGFGRQVKT